MVSLTALLGVVTLSGFAAAQSQEELKALAQAQAAYPTCALECMKTLIPESNCSTTDVQCLCTNEELNLQIAGCALKGCTTYEGLQTKNVSMTMCGAPIRDKSAEPLYIGLVFGGLALLAFILRMCSKVFKEGNEKLRLDDWAIIATVILAGPPTAFAVTLTNNGLGKDMWTLTLNNIKNVLLYYYLGEIFYFAAITATKLSILLFIHRIFPTKRFRLIIYGVGALVVSYGVSFIFATAFQCSPVEWSWQQIDDDWGTGACNNIHVQGWLSALCNIVIDLIMLVLPLKSLWGLQMQLKKKLMIMSMFSLGIFVTIISVIRLRSLLLFANSTNISWDYTEAAWWSTLEIHVGIICACLPAVRQLFIYFGATGLRSKKPTYGSSNAYSPSGSHVLRSGGGVSIGKPRDSVHLSQAPKHGDEGDFVPLVDYPNLKGFDKNSTYSVGVSQTHSTESV